MPLTNSDNPPIHRLNHDILSHIFEQNAHMFADDNALVHTRTASQVCQNWRSLLLATPSLWGKLLDFDALAQSAEYWWEELVRRTGDSVLWIKRTNPPANPPAEKLEKLENQPLALHLLKTVQDNLHRRLQILVVNLDSLEYVRSHASWNRIGSIPAPHLQCFDLSVTSDQDGRRSPYDGYFSPPASFADNAPCLRKLWAATFEINLKAPWVTGLRDLYIARSTRLPKILEALATIECLEFLELHDLWFAEDDKLQNVHLPKLKELRLGSLHPSVCDVLLDYMTFPPDCALKYTLTLSTRWFDDENNDFEIELTALIRRLSQYAQGYFIHHVPTNLLFRYASDLLCITAHARDSSGGFHFQITSNLLNHPDEIKATFFSEFTLPEFNHVTELHLEMAFDENEDVLLLPFIGCLTSVEVLITCCWYPYFFEYFKAKLQSPRSVLPFLKTIKMQKPRRRHNTIFVEEYRDVALSKFIDAFDGYPVEVVFSR